MGVFGIIFKDYFVFLAVPTFAVLFVLAGKLGVLSTGSGILAKVALDGWNVFAGLLLPGAVLKYSALRVSCSQKLSCRSYPQVLFFPKGLSLANLVCSQADLMLRKKTDLGIIQPLKIVFVST